MIGELSICLFLQWLMLRTVHVIKVNIDILPPTAVCIKTPSNCATLFLLQMSSLNCGTVKMILSMCAPGKAGTLYMYTYSIQYETILYSAHCTEYDLVDVLEKCFHHGDTLEMRHFLRPLVHIRPRNSIVSMHFFRRSLCDCNRQDKKLNAKGFLEVSNSTIVQVGPRLD